MEVKLLFLSKTAASPFDILVLIHESLGEQNLNSNHDTAVFHQDVTTSGWTGWNNDPRAEVGFMMSHVSSEPSTAH